LHTGFDRMQCPGLSYVPYDEKNGPLGPFFGLLKCDENIIKNI